MRPIVSRLTATAPAIFRWRGAAGGHSLQLVRWRARRPVSGGPVAFGVRCLPHLDQMTVGIADVTTLLILVLFRWREEVGPPGAPLGVYRLDVSDPDVEEAADPVGIRRCLQDDGRFVIGRPAADVDDDPGVGQRDVSYVSGEGH